MTPVTGGIREGIVFFEHLFQIVLALAIGEAFKQYFPEHKSSDDAVLKADSTPALLTLILLSVTFYLGMDRYFYRSYLNHYLVTDHYELHLIFDSVLFMGESALFFAMSRNLHASRWKIFCALIWLLMAVDVVWCIHGTIFGPVSFAGWMIWDVVFATLILAVRIFVRREMIASWVIAAIAAAVTVVNYDLYWPLYFT